jgi:hypothetical protein
MAINGVKKAVLGGLSGFGLLCGQVEALILFGVMKDFSEAEITKKMEDNYRKQLQRSGRYGEEIDTIYLQGKINYLTISILSFIYLLLLSGLSIQLDTQINVFNTNGDDRQFYPVQDDMVDFRTSVRPPIFLAYGRDHYQVQKCMMFSRRMPCYALLCSPKIKKNMPKLLILGGLGV